MSDIQTLKKSPSRKLIGEGGQGKVYEEKLRDGRLCAVKPFPTAEVDPNRGTELILNENIQHENLLECIQKKNVTLNREKITEYFYPKYDHDTTKYFKLNQSERYEKAQGFLEDIEKAVKHVNSNGLIHCDIKPKNVLVDKKESKYILGDLDSFVRNSDMNGRKRLTDGVTPVYSPPENEDYFQNLDGCKWDPYCLGVSAAEIALGGFERHPHIMEKWEKFQQVGSLEAKMSYIEAVRITIQNDKSMPNDLKKKILLLTEPEKSWRISGTELDEKGYAKKIANDKAKVQHAYNLGAGLVECGANALKKSINGENLTVKEELIRPVTKIVIRAAQIEVERNLRKDVKVTNLANKVGFTKKLEIAAVGAATLNVVNEFILSDEKGDETQKIKNVCKETTFSSLEYSLNYGINKAVKPLVGKSAQTAAVYSSSKAASNGTKFIVNIVENSLKNVAKSSAINGVIGLAVGVAVDGIRILSSDDIKDKKAAFNQSLKSNACSSAGQIIGSIAGSVFGPVGTVVGGVAGGVFSSFISSFLF